MIFDRHITVDTLNIFHGRQFKLKSIYPWRFKGRKLFGIYPVEPFWMLKNQLIIPCCSPWHKIKHYPYTHKMACLNKSGKLIVCRKIFTQKRVMIIPVNLKKIFYSIGRTNFTFFKPVAGLCNGKKIYTVYIVPFKIGKHCYHLQKSSGFSVSKLINGFKKLFLTVDICSCHPHMSTVNNAFLQPRWIFFTF